MKQRGKGRRLLLAVGAPAAVCLVLAYILRGLPRPPCLFRALTGLYCPGCGSGRAVDAALHGRWGEAFRMNVLLPFFGLPAGAVLVWEYFRLSFPRLGLKPVRIPRPAAVGCTVLILAYWVLRNLPALAFLAPLPG